MLSQSDIDQLEGYLCRATLNELPNILMKVLPLMFAELRTMQAALDTQAEEFFSGIPRDDGRGRDAFGRVGDGGAGLPRGSEADARPAAARPAIHVHAVQASSSGGQDDPHPRGLSGEEGLGAGELERDRVGQPVGGQVRHSEGPRPATGSEPNAPVKKRRGRPPKQSAVLDAVLGIEPITHGGE